LKGIDKLRVKTRRDLYSHAAQKQEDIHLSQIRLLVPFDLVLLCKLSENGVGGAIGEGRKELHDE